MNAYRATVAVLAAVFSIDGSIALAEQPASAGITSAAAPFVPKRLWLTDMAEHDVKVGWGNFGKNGWAGFEPYNINVNGLMSPHGLGTHPDCHVDYYLRKRFRTFRGSAAMDISSTPAPQRPIEFRVLGDGKLLWKSRGMHQPNNNQPCLLDITGVDVLRLEVVYRPGSSGDQGAAHAVWIEPYVAVDPPNAELMPYFDPKTFEHNEASEVFRQQVGELLEQEKFDDLEMLAKKYRENDDFTLGLTMLNQTYVGMAWPKDHNAGAWKKHLDRLERWKTAKPNSPTPLVALGDSYIRYAWKARGEGYAYTVTEDSAKAMEERIARARENLEQAMKMKPNDPEAYHLMIGVELLSGNSRDEAEKYFDEGRKISPRYFPLYEAMANYLQPKWHGRPGDIEKCAAKVRSDAGGKLGDELYFFMAKQVSDEFGGDDFFEETNFEYKSLLPGIRLALREYPENCFI
jgi:tetratricopeptide (TPR) repeat protein